MKRRTKACLLHRDPTFEIKNSVFCLRNEFVINYYFRCSMQIIEAFQKYHRYSEVEIHIQICM